MEIAVVLIFVVGYMAIAFEHPIKINKTASALLTGALCWTVYALNSSDVHHVGEQLSEHLREISEILFFLMGAMTIVELVDSYQGFRVVTDRIKTKNPKTLIWGLSMMTFFLSSILDNLTTTIVMVSLLRKLIPNKEMRLFFVGMVIIAANAGGAFSPIGDVTTTMLWIGGQITALTIVKQVFFPSLICMIAPLIYIQFRLKGSLDIAESEPQDKPEKGATLMLIVGVGGLMSVPIFKTLTHLPPYMGMLFALSILWVLSEIVNSGMDEFYKKEKSAAAALSRIDTSSVLFFLGILLAVGSLQSTGLLASFAGYLEQSLRDDRIIITLIGVLSSIVDNVPLVAASMGMYSMDAYPPDSMIWQYLAYCAGTGGSMLIIGSAAGVAAMGMEKVEFIWYLKKVSFLALIGYLAGAAVYLISYPIFFA